MARIARGLMRVRPEPMTLAPLIDQAIETAQQLMEQRHHTLVREIRSEPIRVCADGVRIVQVVSNLLTNAAKLTPPGGKLVVSAHTEAGQAVVHVRDNGVGIDAERLQEIFRTFDRGKSSEEGLGIGLAITRGIVDLHGGEISAWSAGPGAGSELTVRLPLCAPPPGNGQAH